MKRRKGMRKKKKKPTSGFLLFKSSLFLGPYLTRRQKEE